MKALDFSRMTDPNNPFLPHIPGKWKLCFDCAPFGVPLCSSDCEKIGSAEGALSNVIEFHLEILSRVGESSAHFVHQVVWFCLHKRDFYRLLKHASPDGKLEAIEFDAPRTDYRQKKRDRSAGAVSTIAELFEVAEVVDPLFKVAMQKIAAVVGCGVAAKFPPGGLKGKDRAEQKAHNDYNGVLALLFDIVRMTFDCDTGDEVVAIVAAIKASPHVIHTIKGKNRCKNPTANGFFDIMMQVLFQFELGDGSTVEHVCEVQIHIRAATAYAKQNNSHGVYEFFRSYFSGSDETVRARMHDITAILGAAPPRFTEGGGAVEGDVEIPFLDVVDVATVESQALFETFIIDVVQSGDVRRLLPAADLFSNYTLEYELAFALLEAVRAVVVKQVGFGPAVVGAIYSKMAGVLKAQGKYAEAMGWFEKAQGIQVKALGEDHDDVGGTYSGMADVLNSQGKHAEAMAFHKKALRNRVKALGQDHPNVGTIYSKMAGVLTEQGKYAEAMVFYEKVLSIKVKTVGEDDVSIGSTYNNIARVLNDQDKHAEAMAFYEKALKIQLKAFGDDHISVGQMYNNMAAVLVSQDKHAEATPFFEKALGILVKVLGGDHWQIGGIYNNMATVHEHQGKYAEATACYEKALGVFVKALGEDHPHVGGTYSNMADALEKQDRQVEAMAYYEKGLGILVKALGEDHAAVGSTCFNMALLAEKQGKFVQALEYVTRAVHAYTVTHGADHDETRGAVKKADAMRGMLAQ